jgi:hypothetical protein
MSAGALVVLRRFSELASAELAKAFLEAEGVTVDGR